MTVWTKEEESQIDDLVTAAVKAFSELNAIRARDGVPYHSDGSRSGVCASYFSSVIDDLDSAVKAVTGHTAHCHPNLFRRERL